MPKIEIKLKETVETKEEVEFEYPLYRFSSYEGDFNESHSIYKLRLNTDGDPEEIELEKSYDQRNGTTEYKIEISDGNPYDPSWFKHNDRNSFLGARGPCKAEEFEKLKKEILDYLENC